MFDKDTTMKELEFNPDLFNDLFYKLDTFKTRWVISYGGAGSSKSYSQAQYEVFRALQKKEKILVLRKVASTLKLSVVPLIVDTILIDWEIRGDFKYHETNKVLTNKINGSQIIFAGLDDPEKIKSIHGVTRIWIEEATEFDEEDIKQLNLRLRGKKGLQLTLTFNPIEELHWIKKKFFDGEENVTIIKTTYRDNKFIDDDYIAEIELYKRTDPNYYAIYALGEWGRLTIGGEFYKSFSVVKHTTKAPTWNKTLPLHITFDENVHPWVTLNVWQADALKVWQIDEIALEDPKNTLSDTMAEFIKLYPRNAARVFIYGDATSKKQDVKLQKGYNFYTLVEKALDKEKYIYERRVPASNPHVELRGNFINDIFERGTNNCDIKFGENCIKTISDYQYLKQASDGSKHKENVRNPTTKVTYQKWGHMSDANDYFFCQYFSAAFAEFKSPTSSVKRHIKKHITKGGY